MADGPSSLDPRDIHAGHEISCEEYCDQPYVVHTQDGAWLCVMTTARGHEGTNTQHIVATRSTDAGRTWSPLIDVEPSGPPESSYATVLKTPSGRVYAFYNHNTDNLRSLPRRDGTFEARVDTQGHFVFKYSDDGGLTWSPRRYEIPIRQTRVDRDNPTGGKVKFFWHVGRPLLHPNGSAYVTLHKVGEFAKRGFMTGSEGWFLRSANILTERDPERITWETLPEGDVGLIAPPGGGPIAEEQSIVALSDGSLYCTYRTISGHPAHAYSRDGGRTWTPPAYMAYADGRLVRHPRAANFVWRCENGHFLYWFHNHGGQWYDDRNPAWVIGAVEADGPNGKVLHWSQPEILLYDADPKTRMSYPDLVEEKGRFWVTETQKTVARVHEIDTSLLTGLWDQFGPGRVTHNGLLWESVDSAEAEAPRLPLLTAKGGGFSVEASVHFDDLAPGQILADTRGADGAGWSLTITDHATIRLTLSDGRTENAWECDTGRLQAGRRHHIVATVDGGPKIITFLIDGVFCDGGEQRQFGWGRFSPYLGDVSGSGPLRLSRGLHGHLSLLRLYSRPLRTSEAVGNFRAGHETA